MRTFSVVVLCLLLLSGISADDTCKRGCPTSDEGPLRYVPGHVYEYAFDSVMTVGLHAGGDADDTNMKMAGVAKVFAEGNCGYTLQLGGIRVTTTKDTPVEKKLTQSIQKPVHFTMVNGKVQPQLCADPSDSTYALNIKRAIISLLQSGTASESTEVDVFGQCVTHTSESTVGNSHVITKVRNLNNCAYREKIKNGIVNGVVNEQAGIKSTNLLNADYAKELKVDRGVVDNVRLVEEYKLSAALKEGANVQAKVVTTLKLKNAAGAPAAAPATDSHSTSIIFELPESNAVKNAEALKQALSEVVQLVEVNVKQNSAKHFVELIRLMRNADDDSLLGLAAFPHPNKVLARQVYLDALFRTGTAESAKAILKQLGKMNEKEKAIALLSLNIVQTVDKEVLNQAAALLTANAPKEAYLAVGNVVSKYCQSNSCSGNQIDGIMKRYIDNLKHCKANTKKDEKRIVYVLKGIGNTHHLSSNAAAALSECVSVGHSTRIRVAALQALSSASCDPAAQKKVLSILKDTNEDAEVRIEAYLAAITCPSTELANEIAEIVNSETVYQVGGFIASSLRAIRDSTDATREHQRHFLGNIRVTKVFPKDLRRYSYNNELSYRLDALGSSASADYKLLYSQHGFLPRSARLNVTTEVFGTNFNVFEASIRQENLENVLEYYVGPKGLANKDFEEIIKMIQFGGADPSGGGRRARRSIADEAAKVSKKYKTYGSKSSQDLNLDIAVKLFGSEMLFLSLGDNIPSSLDDIISYFSGALETVKKELSEFNKEFIVHNFFLDIEFLYPTGVGIPLELRSQGFAANKLDLGVSVDVDAILDQNWQHAKYRFKVVPSTDVTVNVEFGLNAQVLATGIRVASSLHSAVGSDVNFALINDGNGFNMDIELPRDKMELIDLQLNADFYVAEQDKPTRSAAFKGAKKRKPEVTNACFDNLEIVGINVCVSSTSTPKVNDIQGAELLQLLQSHSFSLYVNTERKYNLKGLHNPKTASGTEQWKFDFSTPGSAQNHDTSFIFELGVEPRTFGRLSFLNPEVQFALEAGINNDDKELVLYAQIEHNHDIKKNRIGFSKRGNEYRPIIELVDKSGPTNHINGYSADGRVVVQKVGPKQDRYNFENFKITNKNNEGVVINGWAEIGPKSLTSELKVAPGQSSYLVKNNFKMDEGEYVLELFVNDERTPQNVIGGSAQVKVKEQDVYLQLSGKAAAWEVLTVHAFSWVKAEESDAISSNKFKNEVTVKHKNNLVGSFVLNGFTEQANKFQVQCAAQYIQKTGSLLVSYSGNERAEGDYVLKVNGKLNKHYVDLIAKCDVNGNHFVIDNTFSSSWGTTITAKGELGQRYTPQDIHINLQGTAQTTGKDKPIQWTLKVMGAPEKTNSEFRLLRENAELVKFTGDVQHPQDKVTSGKVNLVVKSVLNAKAELKVAKNGKGELTATVDTLKTDPKHKIELNSNFHIQAPKYDIETTVLFDADKKVYFKTENNLDKLKFSTKNVAEVANKQLSFDANGLVKGDYTANGEVQGTFTFTCPEGRVIDGTLKRKLTTNAKTGIAQGTMELQLNDQLPNNGKKRSFASTGKIERFNIKAKEMSLTNHFVYTDFEGRKLDANYHIKHLPKGHNKMIDFGLTAVGELTPKPIEISLVVDEYSAKHGIYHVNVKYGTQVTGNLNGNYNLGEPSTPTKYAMQGKLELPESNFKIFEIEVKSKFMRPATEGGAYVLQLLVNERTNNNQFVKLDTTWESSRHQGVYNFNLQTDQMQGPLKLDGSYQRDDVTSSAEGGSASGKHKYVVGFKYADKYVNSATDLSYAGGDTVTIHYTLDTSFEEAKAIDVDVRAQKLEGDSMAIKVQARQAEHNYAVDTKFYRSSHKKGIDVHGSLPNGKPIVLKGIFELLGERKAKFSFDIDNVIDLDLKGNAEASYTAVEDFYVRADWNSNKLHLQNYNLDVTAKDTTLTFNLKNAEGVVLAGSATYALKKEKSKAIIEGQGQLQYQGKTHNTNFRLTRQIYELTADKEVGFSYTFNGNFGPKNGVSTLKITNKDFNVKFSICEEKKQCSNVQVQSLVNGGEHGIDSTQHSLLILIDLRELGYPYEFEFQSKTVRQGFKVEYSLDSNIVSNHNLKYQLVANILPTSSKLQLKLPNREILFETKQAFPEHGKLFGHYENSAVFYFDKVNKPNDVTRLTSIADISGAEHVSINVKGAIKLEHPTIRPLAISGKIDANREKLIVDSEVVFDIFRTPAQQVVASSLIKNIDTSGHGYNLTYTNAIRSNELGLHYEVSGHTALSADRQEFSASAEVHSGITNVGASAAIFANKDHVDVSVYGLSEQLFHLSADFNRQKYTSKVETTFQLFGQKPVELTTELDPSSAKFSFKRPDLLDAQAELRLSKELKFNVEGAGKKLFNGRVALDPANFLQADYTSNDEGIKNFLDTVEKEVQKDTTATREKLKSHFQNVRQTFDRQIQLLKDSTPDLSKLKANYQGNVDDILKELENDPSLKQLAEQYRHLYTKLAKILGDVVKSLADLYESFHKTFVALYEKWQIILRDTILPAWEEFMVIATKLIGELRVEALNLNTKAFQALMSAVEKYGPSLKAYGKAIHEALKPLHEAAQELLKVAAQLAEDFLKELKDCIAKLPTWDAIRNEIKERLEKMQFVEKALEFINNFFEQLHIIPQTPEVVEFLKKSRTYVEAKLKQQVVNDEKLVEEIFELFLKAVRSIWETLDASSTGIAANINATNWANLLASSIPFGADIWNKLPALISFRFSLLNFVLNENWENILTTEHLKSWIFFQNFELSGHVADGRHIFTFDGKEFNFPGTCKYILAQDSVDNNFTVIAQLNNGKLKSIILADRDGSFVEINDGGVLKRNGNPVEFPQHEAGIHAWRRFYTVWLLSEYGVQVMCTTDLKVCHINVNGFYTSKTRGLLGNGNAEPNDDYIQIDGKIAADYASFGNGYGLGNCQPVVFDEKTVGGKTEHSPICNEIFGLESPLVLGYLFLDAKPYRSACDQAVLNAPEKDKEAAACTIATAYGSALRLQHKDVMLPPSCLKCAGAAAQRDLGQEFTVKIPNNKADLVFVVDVGVSNNLLTNLVAPAITQVRESLKTRGFTDVQIGVIAYNESQRYPALLTSGKGNINYQGNLAEVQLNGPKNFCDNCISQVAGDHRLYELYETIEGIIKSIVPQSDEMAFGMALKYPFRAGAAKSIIDIRSSNLEYGNVIKFIRAHIAGAVTKFDGALLHMVAPVKDLSLEGVPTEKLVGFNSRLVATLDGKDGKKRQKLQFKNDMGVDFVLNNGGWVFATQDFDKLKPAEQNKFLQQVTNSISDTLFRTEIVSECKCLPVHGLHAQHKCAITSSNFLPNKKVKAA